MLYLLLVLATLDVSLTIYLTNISADLEANPVALAALHSFGPGGLVALKVLSLSTFLMCYLCIRKARPRLGWAILAFAVCANLWAVVSGAYATAAIWRLQ